MTAEVAHASVVRDWAAGISADASGTDVVHMFEGAFNAVWARAHVTLGEVTLSAIVDRVLFDAAERAPLVAALDVQPTGFQFERLLELSKELPSTHVASTLEAVLVDLLTVIGRLTSEILTPALHSALSAVALPPPAVATRDEREDGRS
jgi:hypothetical protein